MSMMMVVMKTKDVREDGDMQAASTAAFHREVEACVAMLLWISFMLGCK